MNFKLFSIAIAVAAVSATACCCSNDKGRYVTPDKFPSTEKPEEKPTAGEKPFYIWVDSGANFPDFANSKENIARDLALAKDAGFTDVVVEVRPTNGDVLFKTDKCQQVEWLGAWLSTGYTKIERTATWDYLQAFIDEGHKLGLRIHAGMNTMVGGHGTGIGQAGILYRDKSKKDWATTLNTTTGYVNAAEQTTGTIFFNPVHEEVQEYLLGLIGDLAAYKDLDGIILDRCRFDGMQSDFSDYTKKKFLEYMNMAKIDWAKEVAPAGMTYSTIPSTYPAYFRQWLEFRAKVIHDFVEKASKLVHEKNSKIKFGVYVGGWYSQYYDVGVNWASPTFNAGANYKWATSNYMKYGYADHCDQMLIGAYASPTKVYGSGEWTMQGFCLKAVEKIGTACPLVVGGPDVGNWDTDNKVSQDDENQAIVNSVKACYDACGGYFLFDMIHLKKANQWQYVKKGIALARGSE